MRDQVRFNTSLFAPPTEQNENGILLAEWLCSHLPSNFKADYLDEDWGCRVIFADPCFSKITLGCSHIENKQWSIACFVDRSLIDKLFKRPMPTEELNEIVRAIDISIADEINFTDVEWFKNDGRLQETDYGSRAFDE